jgi:microcystin-dependent protein
MKLKMLIVDLEIPPRVKRWALRIWGFLAVLAGFSAIAYASLPKTWGMGDMLTATDLNNNFAAVQTPPGTIEAYGGSIDFNPGHTVDGGAPAHPPPSGWLLCNGDHLNGQDPTYAALYAAIRTNFGGDTMAQTFYLPDLRGMFLRGVDTGDPSSRDPDATARTAAALGGNAGSLVGSVEGHALASHAHGVTDPGHQHGLYPAGPPNNGINSTLYGNANGDIEYSNTWTAIAKTGISINATGGSETRPLNTYVNYIIKY